MWFFGGRVGVGGHYYECISLTGNYFRKMSIKVENRNADEHTKADMKASEGSEMFYKVLIGKANNAITCTFGKGSLEQTFAATKCFGKSFFFFFFKNIKEIKLK